MLQHRKIIEIDQSLCNGCGQCVLDCAEGAIRIENGKAKVISDTLCDGLGACMGGCPQGALRIVERMAVPFDVNAVHAHLHAQNQPPRSCPGAMPQTLMAAPPPPVAPAPGAGAQPLLAPRASAMHWPVKLRLVPPNTLFLSRAHLLLAADCAPAVCQDFPALARGKVVLLSCPKFEDTAELTRKLAGICVTQQPCHITVLRMDVPCCTHLSRWVDEAMTLSQCEGGLMVPVTHLCLGRDGRLLGTV